MRFVAVLVWLLPVVAMAAEEGHQEAHGGGGWIMLILTVANFAIFVGLMRHFASAPLRDYLRGRRQEVADAIAAADKAKAEADALKREYETKAAGLEQARKDLIDEIRSIANADRERALAAAREASDRLREDAERRARSELERARQELRAEAAILAAEIAAKRVGERLDEPRRRRLLDEFLGRVDRR
jgi:F-type H+-transporting ATPase subunit b